MPASTVGLLQQLGLLVIKDFLDPTECERLRLEASSRPIAAAGVVRKDQERVDEAVRKTGALDVEEGTRQQVAARLEAFRPGIAAHFGLPLSRGEDPQFLVYGEGDFFRPHRDNSDHPAAVDYMKARKISVVIFLSTETEQAVPPAGEHAGGTLMFFGLIEGAAWSRLGIGLHGESGMLVGFRSEILHEVTPVTAGRRLTVVSWLH